MKWKGAPPRDIRKDMAFLWSLGKRLLKLLGNRGHRGFFELL